MKQIRSIQKEILQLQDSKTWNNISEDFETKLATWSNGINKKTNINSQNVLRIVNDTKFAFRIPRLNTQSSQRLTQKPPINENLFSIYPNPNNGHFTYVLNKEYTVDLQYTISDVTGKIISKGLLENHSKTGYIKINANAGLYIIRINHIDFRSTNLKIVIQ